MDWHIFVTIGALVALIASMIYAIQKKRYVSAFGIGLMTLMLIVLKWFWRPALWV